MATTKKRTDQQIKQDKTDSIMNAIALWTSYYRSNPHRFVKDFLGIELKLFQKILLWAMMFNDVFFFIAARGLGKTYLVALFCVVRCILYPGTKVVASSGTFKQGREIVLKITDDFMQHSSLLRGEILKVQDGQNKCEIIFKNGSWIRITSPTETSRGARGNIVIIDECRMVSQHIVDTVFIPMNAAPRMPGYLNNPEYEHLKEMNKVMYMSSAWYSASEMFKKMKAYFANFLDDKFKYFEVDLPYQVSIKEGLLMRESIENEMSEQTFNDITFMMEREGLFYGSSADALFDFDVINKRRILSNSIHPLEYYRDNNLHIPEKQIGELRVLSVDVALLASKKHNNDASCLILHSAIPSNDNDYLDNIVYLETYEGLTADELGIIILRWYYQYDCDYIALDSNGVGQSVLDYIMADRYDPLYGESYQGLDCIDNPEMSERCKTKGADKVIYAIKANAKMNNDMCLSLRAAFQNGYINLLVSDSDCDNILSKMRGYSKQTESMQAKLKMPYVQTSFLVNELINLTHDVSNGLIRVKEKASMRKDRYSSLEYGYYVVQEQSKNLKPNVESSSLLDLFITRPAIRR